MDTVVCDLAGKGSAAAGGLEWKGEGDRLYLGISEGEARRALLVARLGAGAVVVLGVALSAVTPWGWLLVAGGLVAGFALPHLFRSEALLLAEPEAGRLTPLQPELAGQTLACTDALEVRGAYETQGWDARSVIRVVLADGTETPVLILPGADERKAEAACRLLAELLACPAVYTGAMGKPKRVL